MEEQSARSLALCIDTLVAALALRVPALPASVIVLTSDRDDWSKL